MRQETPVRARMTAIVINLVSDEPTLMLNELIESISPVDGPVVVMPSGNEENRNSPRRNIDLHPRHPRPVGAGPWLRVGGYGQTGAPSDRACYGPNSVALLAPSESILLVPFQGLDAGTQPFIARTGTSWAVPIVAATASLVAEACPNLTAQQIVRRILSTVVTRSDYVNVAAPSGRVNVYRALTGLTDVDPGTTPDAGLGAISCDVP